MGELVYRVYLFVLVENLERLPRRYASRSKNKIVSEKPSRRRVFYT